MSEQITDIVVRFSEDGLFGYDTDANARIDIPASKAAYIQAIKALLATEYPGAEIDVAEGPDNTPLRIDGDSDHTEILWIEAILYNVWESWTWVKHKEVAR